MTELLVTHREDLIRNHKHCWLEQMARVTRVAIDRLVKVNPLRSELVHILPYFTNLLKMLTLTCGNSISDVEEGKCLLFEATIEAKKLFVGGSCFTL